MLLWPVQAVHALPESQLQEIKQTIDRDFQDGQVRLLPAKGTGPNYSIVQEHTSAKQGALLCVTEGVGSIGVTK